MTHGASRGHFGVPTPWRKAEGHTGRSSAQSVDDIVYVYTVRFELLVAVE